MSITLDHIHYCTAHLFFRWRRLRRASHNNFNFNAVKKFEPFQVKAFVRGVLRMIAKPDDWQHNIDVYVGHISSRSSQSLTLSSPRSVISAVYASVYGRPLESDSPVIAKAQAYMARIAKDSSPGLFLLELFPVLTMVPAWLAAWKNEALQWHENTTRFFEQLLGNLDKETVSPPEYICRFRKVSLTSELIAHASRRALIRCRHVGRRGKVWSQ